MMTCQSSDIDDDMSKGQSECPVAMQNFKLKKFHIWWYMFLKYAREVPPSTKNFSVLAFSYSSLPLYFCITSATTFWSVNVVPGVCFCLSSDILNQCLSSQRTDVFALSCYAGRRLYLLEWPGMGIVQFSTIRWGLAVGHGRKNEIFQGRKSNWVKILHFSDVFFKGFACILKHVYWSGSA